MSSQKTNFTLTGDNLLLVSKCCGEFSCISRGCSPRVSSGLSPLHALLAPLSFRVVFFFFFLNTSLMQLGHIISDVTWVTEFFCVRGMKSKWGRGSTSEVAVTKCQIKVCFKKNKEVSSEFSAEQQNRGVIFFIHVIQFIGTPSPKQTLQELAPCWN